MRGISTSARYLMLVSAVILSFMSAGCPLTGVTREQEIQLGQQVAAEVERQYRTFENAEVTRTGQRLAAISGRPDLPWRFRVVDVEQVNAFALPGGPVYLTSGLLEFTRGRPAELEAVIAHEVAHIARRHQAQQIERQAWLGLGIGVLTRGTAQDIAVLAANLEQLGYTRGQERDADTWGAVYLARVGSDPAAMARVLQRLGAERGDTGLAFLRTHPPAADRVRRVEDQIRTGEIQRLAAQR